MPFEDKYDELNRMLVAKSTDYEKMRSILQVIREVHGSARLFEAAQDDLYASIARSHPEGTCASGSWRHNGGDEGDGRSSVLVSATVSGGCELALAHQSAKSLG
jgi:hypothetical protein